MNTLEIASVRELFPDEELYYIKLSDFEYIFKVISPVEYGLIKEVVSDTYAEEDLITQTAVIYPDMFNSLGAPAGVPKVIAGLVLEYSMLGDKYKYDRAVLGQSYMQNIAEDPEAQIPILIKMAFPEFTFEQIDSWTIDKIMKNFARALWALDKRGVDVSMYTITYTPEPEMTLLEKEIAMIEAGIDPVLALYDEYKPVVNVVDIPFITGVHWNNEEINNAVQRQIYESRQRKIQ